MVHTPPVPLKVMAFPNVRPAQVIVSLVVAPQVMAEVFVHVIPTTQRRLPLMVSAELPIKPPANPVKLRSFTDDVEAILTVPVPAEI